MEQDTHNNGLNPHKKKRRGENTHERVYRQRRNIMQMYNGFII